MIERKAHIVKVEMEILVFAKDGDEAIRIAKSDAIQTELYTADYNAEVAAYLPGGYDAKDRVWGYADGVETIADALAMTPEYVEAEKRRQVRIDNLRGCKLPTADELNEIIEQFHPRKTPEGHMTDCDCKSCQRLRFINEAIASRDPDRLIALVQDQLVTITVLEMDDAYHNSILDGSWPSAKEILTDALALAEKVNHDVRPRQDPRDVG
jgi:hypothetical protein